MLLSQGWTNANQEQPLTMDGDEAWWKLHVSMYVMGDKYGIARLKSKALHTLYQYMHDKADMWLVMDEFTQAGVEGNKDIRTAMVDYMCFDGLSKWKEEERFKSWIKTDSEAALAVLERHQQLHEVVVDQLRAELHEAHSKPAQKRRRR